MRSFGRDRRAGLSSCMAYYLVIRNNKEFGPYDAPTLADMVSRGRVLRCDKAFVEGTVYDGKTTVGSLLAEAGWNPRVKSGEGIFRQISNIGTEVIFPRGDVRPEVWKQDTKLIMMAAVGLLPLVVELFGWWPFMTFYLISLYFSAMWALFFFYLFKTRQVSARSAFAVFFITQVLVFTAWDVLGVVRLNPFYAFEGARTLMGKALYYVCGVGVTEELAKALPLFFITARAREPLVPQTMVFYGLISGIAFGVFEGVQYQMTVNSELGYSESFMMNIARLTTLPFAHSLWAGVAGYFISFALLYPAYKWALWVLAIAIPAVMHGVYDIACDYSTGGVFVRGAIIFFSALLLITYLKRGADLQERLSSLTR